MLDRWILSGEGLDHKIGIAEFIILVVEVVHSPSRQPGPSTGRQELVHRSGWVHGCHGRVRGMGVSPARTSGTQAEPELLLASAARDAEPG